MIVAPPPPPLCVCRCLTFSADGGRLFSGHADVLGACAWEPERWLDTVTVGWGRVADLALCNQQLVRMAPGFICALALDNFDALPKLDFSRDGALDVKTERKWICERQPELAVKIGVLQPLMVTFESDGRKAFPKRWRAMALPHCVTSTFL